MSDLVKRLRAFTCGCETSNPKHDAWEAADRIEALEAALREARASALEEAATKIQRSGLGWWPSSKFAIAQKCANIVRSLATQEG